MFDRLILRKRREVESQILRHYKERYHPHAILVPSGRYGLYAVAKRLLSPGDRVILSPITCRSVVLALLAAGVRPVFADIESTTGNLDPGRLSPALLDSARAIVTTNLYGNPDDVRELKRLAELHRLLLVEDCAHVLHTTVGGQPIGSFGDVSVFSFKKFFDETGGVVVIRNARSAAILVNHVSGETSVPPEREERYRYLQYLLRKHTRPGIVAPLSALYRRCRSPQPEAPDLAATQHSVATVLPTLAAMFRVASLLSQFESLVAGRKAASRHLLDRCPLHPKISRISQDVCPLVVPFASPRRDALVSEMRNRGIPTYFLYTPPMNQAFATLTAGLPLDTARIDEWCRTILPIRPQFSRQYLECIQSFQNSDDLSHQKSA